MFSLHGLPFHLRSFIVKPGSVTGNQSGEESLWVIVVKREHLFTILHPSSCCSALKSLENQSAQSCLISQSLWIIE